MIVRFVTLLGVVAAVSMAALGLLSPAGAAAAAPSPVADCNANGRLTARYTTEQLRHALDTMSADVREYTDCYNVIDNQLLAQLGSSHVRRASTAGSGGSFLPTPLLVVLGVLVLAAAGFGAVAVRRRQ